jgi:signal transduction histidine kinase
LSASSALSRFWPASLASRTLLTLLVGLALVQGAGLTIHAYDRIELQHRVALEDIGYRAMVLYRSMVGTAVAGRPEELKELDLQPGEMAQLAAKPPEATAPLTPEDVVQRIRTNFGRARVHRENRPHGVVMHGMPWDGKIEIDFNFPEGGWLVLDMPVPRPRPWHSPTFLLAFVLMTLAAAGLSGWAVARLTQPVSFLAAAAERLGRDVNSPPLPETGPSEVARAAVAFNTMASRIRRFVQDRTFLLSAIGHDLRTPITRLKLRAEFIDDDEMRGKFLADLDELDTMVGSALAFGRDAADTEPAVPLDLAALLRTLLDEVSDAQPEVAERVELSGQSHVTFRGRPVALKRAFGNLITNALKYGEAARVLLTGARDGHITVTVEDNGPGVPEDQLERVFDPFYRVEDSRNRETGGTGLGLPIARNIFLAHGGNVTVENNPAGGLRAVVVLPV